MPKNKKPHLYHPGDISRKLEHAGQAYRVTPGAHVYRGDVSAVREGREKCSTTSTCGRFPSPGSSDPIGHYWSTFVTGEPMAAGFTTFGVCAACGEKFKESKACVCVKPVSLSRNIHQHASHCVGFSAHCWR